MVLTYARGPAVTSLGPSLTSLDPNLRLIWYHSDLNLRLILRLILRLFYALVHPQSNYPVSSPSPVSSPCPDTGPSPCPGTYILVLPVHPGYTSPAATASALAGLAVLACGDIGHGALN